MHHARAGRSLHLRWQGGRRGLAAIAGSRPAGRLPGEPFAAPRASRAAAEAWRRSRPLGQPAGARRPGKPFAAPRACRAFAAPRASRAAAEAWRRSRPLGPPAGSGRPGKLVRSIRRLERRAQPGVPELHVCDRGLSSRRLTAGALLADRERYLSESLI